MSKHYTLSELPGAANNGFKLYPSRHEDWRLFTDAVMGGVSLAELDSTYHQGRKCLHLSGKVSLENNGGFVQMARDLSENNSVNLTKYRSISLDVLGNNTTYNVHLRTADTVRPWQSYRAEFTATQEWRTIDIPLSDFTPHRIDLPLDLSKVKRIGLVAIGREFDADLFLAHLAVR